MIPFTLSIENLPSVRRATTADIERAIESLRSPTGPTYLNITGPDGSYAQTGGTTGRYVIESRDVYGEGFLHWRAGVPSKSDEKTSVYFYAKCNRGIHRPRSCPYKIDAADVLGWEDVKEALLHYAVHGKRHRGYAWRDVSSEYSCPPKDDLIQELVPARREENDAR
jgi:hypothetical protein